MILQKEITVATDGRGIYELTQQVAAALAGTGVGVGSCQVFIHHTSASLMLCENADPAVMRDLEAWMSRAVPDGDALYTHTAEGPDDMPAHVRSVLTQSDLNLPVENGRLKLGTWQGIYLWEHRHAPHRRRITVTLLGEAAD